MPKRGMGLIVASAFRGIGLIVASALFEGLALGGRKDF